MSSTVVKEAGRETSGASCRTRLGEKSVMSPDRRADGGQRALAVLPIEAKAKAVVAFLPDEVLGQLVAVSRRRNRVPHLRT